MKIEIEEFRPQFTTLGEQVKDFNRQLTKLGFPSVRFFGEDCRYECLTGCHAVALNVAPWVAKLDFNTQQIMSVIRSQLYELAL